MASVLDVTAYILQEHGPMTTWKLQKLVYYSQAWSLVWDDEPLFQEEIEAWANGPVVPDLYRVHRGKYRVRKIGRGNPEALSKDGKETVDAVLGYYGDKSPQYLSDLTHAEDPWQEARRGIPDSERGEAIVTKGSLSEYYGNL